MYFSTTALEKAQGLGSGDLPHEVLSLFPRDQEIAGIVYLSAQRRIPEDSVATAYNRLFSSKRAPGKTKARSERGFGTVRRVVPPAIVIEAVAGGSHAVGGESGIGKAQSAASES